MEQRFSRVEITVEQRFLRENAEVEAGLPSPPMVVEKSFDKSKLRTSRSVPIRAARIERSYHVRA